ncbi:VanZ family protein [Paenibacillus wulumuqiensis]|uniref:VanZ family protein n=1 Tax=Paenibacillus wulumuqiensis TaxID=1567107 RepID=UPI0006972670|nr:VanZ family protein [Paenibacillus wulumuqiensis]
MNHPTPRSSPAKSTFGIVPLILLVIYLYLLTRMILFKGSPIDPGMVKIQLLAWLQQPDLIYTRTVNLIPFQEISRDWSRLSLHPSHTSIQLIGNVLAFIPLGIFIPVLLKRRLLSAVLVLPLSFLLSLAYEVTQLLTGMGIFDVDDLMLNTTGGVIGYAGFAVIVFFVQWFIGTQSAPTTTQHTSKSGI